MTIGRGARGPPAAEGRTDRRRSPVCPSAEWVRRTHGVLGSDGATERDAIDCQDLSKPAAVPAGYGLPEMESKETFRGTMVIGYYQGKPIFIEPMVTRAMLMEKKSFDLAIPDVPGLGAHPTKFRAEHDAAQSAYRFTFSGFVPAG